MRQIVITRQRNCAKGAKFDNQVTSFQFCNSSIETALLTQKKFVCSPHGTVATQIWFQIAKFAIVEAIEYHTYKTAQIASLVLVLSQSSDHVNFHVLYQILNLGKF